MEFMSEQVDKLFAALAKAQGQFKTVGATTQVKIPTKDGKSYTYEYATLAQIWDVIRKPLSDNGLSVSQPVVSGELLTILAHESGQYIISAYSLPHNGEIKTFGANLSYLRRYALSPLVGAVSGDEDDEAQVSGSVNVKPQAQSKPAQSSQTQPPVTTPSTNGKKLSGDAMTTYWSKVRELDVDKTVAASILKNAGNDAVKAFDVLTGTTQPTIVEANEAGYFMAPGVEVKSPQGPGAAYDDGSS